MTAHTVCGFPTWQGCFSAADREEDIISNAIEALLLHLEDEGAATCTTGT